MASDYEDEDIDGCIHSIHVRNFFCHDNLEVKFNRNINFVVGRNGSGKSAILTALVVGLGGRATATNRGTKLSSFIKKGANSATVEIKIKNNSAKAYKPNVYGNYITIVRNINASGGSGYKVKSATGEVISTKFEEVNSIILAHDIQVDNPISVLNQDDARSFHASDSKKKYALFRKATNLDQAESNYCRAIENCEKASAIWKKKNDATLELEKECKKWEASYAALQSRDEIEARQRRLQDEYYWSEVGALERAAGGVRAQAERQRDRVRRLDDQLRQLEESDGDGADGIQQLRDQIASLKSAEGEQQARLSAAAAAAQAAGAAARAGDAAAARRGAQRAREERKLGDLEKEIAAIESGASSSRQTALQARAEQAAAAAAAAAARYDTAQHEAAQARAAAARAAAAEDAAAAAAAAVRDRLKQTQQQARELAARGGDALAVFGRAAAELRRRVAAAAQRGDFSKEPKGPVGAYLKMKDKRWGGALEHVLGGAGQAWCVHSPADSRKLFEIMEQVYGSAPKPAVTCSAFLPRAHDTSRHAVRAPGHCSALDALDVTDPVIKNYLIDNIGMEKILLVPEHDEAISLADTEARVPPNCSKIVTLDCTEYLPAPNYCSYGGTARAPRYLSLSSEERTKQLEAESAEARRQLAAREAEAAAAAAAAAGARGAERAAARALQALLAERGAADAAARAARAALGQLQAPQHSVLVEELSHCRETLARLTSEEAAEAAAAAARRARADEREREAKAARAALADTTASVRSLTDQVEQRLLTLEQSSSARRLLAARAAAERDRLARVDDILRGKDAELALKVREAETLCPRVEDARETAVVCEELKKTQLKLSALRDAGLGRAEVAARLLDATRRLGTARAALARLEGLIGEIKKTADKHLRFCHRVQTYIARRVQFCFQSILTLRGYSGRMDIDNARGALDIFCSGRDAAGRRAASTSSLSGGERSYSTVAFIMALWDCVELPFYFMDEFDVFMDNVNRKIVMDLLVDHAMKNAHRQFVFLTPQDASAVVAGPRVKIHRMADPRR